MLRTTTSILALVALMNVAALGQARLASFGAPSDGRNVKLGGGELQVSLSVKTESRMSVVGLIAWAPGIEPQLFELGYTDSHGRFNRDYVIPMIFDKGAVQIFALVLDCDCGEITQSNSLVLHYDGRHNENPEPGTETGTEEYKPLEKADVSAMERIEKPDVTFPEQNQARPEKADVRAAEKNRKLDTADRQQAQPEEEEQEKEPRRWTEDEKRLAKKKAAKAAQR